MVFLRQRLLLSKGFIVFCGYMKVPNLALIKYKYFNILRTLQVARKKYEI